MKLKIEDFVPIKELSYWRFIRLRSCLLSGSFQNFSESKLANKKTKGRAQLIGDVFHDVMERINEISKRTDQISGSEIRSIFNQALNNVKKQSVKSSLGHFGDPSQWPEIIQIYKSISDFAARCKNFNSARPKEVHSEVKLSSRDGLLFGVIDAFFVFSNGIELVDYKSGRMIDDEYFPKEEYANQLLFYAYLIHENYGVYPHSLTLLGKDFDSVSIEPSFERSVSLANEMRQVLSHYNDSVSCQAPIRSFSNPTIENCLYCEAKPLCSPFWDHARELGLPRWGQVAIGKQVKPLVISRGGWGTLEIEILKSSLHVPRLKMTRILIKRFPDLRDNLGQCVIVTNLKILGGESSGIAEVTGRSEIIPFEGNIGT